jgi:hypothetical protein
VLLFIKNPLLLPGDSIMSLRGLAIAEWGKMGMIFSKTNITGKQ